MATPVTLKYRVTFIDKESLGNINTFEIEFAILATTTVGLVQEVVKELRALGYKEVKYRVVVT